MTAVISRFSARAFIDRSLRGDGDRALLTRQAGGSFALKVASAALALVSGILFARILGIEGYGAYAYAMSWLVVLTSPSLAGGDRLVVREVATYVVRSQWSRLRGILQWAATTVLAVSVAVSAGGLLLVWLLPIQHEASRTALVVALLVLPIAALLAAGQAALRGLRRVLAGQWPALVAKPAIAIALLVAVALGLGLPVDAPRAVLFQGLATLVALAVCLWLLLRAVPVEAKGGPAHSEGREWLRRALPFLVLSGVVVANEQIEILMLGTFVGPEETALFAVARRGAYLVAFPLLAVNAALAPAIARFHAGDDAERLQLALRKSAGPVLVASAVIAVALIALGPWFLRLFGPQYVEAHLTLAVLSAGHALSVMAGSVVTLLIMTGHERFVIRSLASILAMKVAALGLAVTYGDGVAVAFVAASALVLWNVVLCAHALRVLQVDSTAFGMLRRIRGRRAELSAS